MRKRRVHRMRMKRKAQCMSFLRATGITTVVLLVATGAVFAGRMVYEVPGLRITHLYVNGCEDGIAEEVLACAEPYRNTNILAADLVGLQSTIESNPWIEQAVIRREYPDTVSITVRVREARAVLVLDEEFLVDANGAVFSRVSGRFTNLPLVCGIQREDVEKHPARAARMINDGLRIIDGLQAYGLPQDDNVRITCSREFGYTLRTEPNGPEIYLGFDNYHYKISALPRMLADLRRRGLSARFIHLHSSERAFVKLVNQESGTRRAQAEKAAGGSLPS